MTTELEHHSNYIPWHFIRQKKGAKIKFTPVNEKGELTKQARYSEQYGKRIARTLDLPIAWVNEHSSSWAAAQKYNLQNDRTGQLDSAAACLLLEQWLREGPALKPVHMPAYPMRHVN